MKKTRNLCKHCGLPANQHHTFDPLELVVPERCVCFGDGWVDINNIPEICNSYEEGVFGICNKCEHNKKCHQK